MKKIFVSFVTLCLIACNKDLTTDVVSDLKPESPLGVNVSSLSTKGEIVEDAKGMGSMGVYCAYTGSEDCSKNTEFSKLNNRRFDFSSDGEWVIEGETEYWGYNTENDKYTFFAYSPYYEDEQIVSTYIDEGELAVYYKVPNSSTEQYDLMYAVPIKNITPQEVVGSVPLTFRHVLSCVSFSVLTTLDVKITEISVTGVMGKGTFIWDYTNNEPLWSLTGSSKRDFSVEIDSNYVADDENPVQVNTNKGYLMMLPQELTNGAEVTLKLSNNEEKVITISDTTVWKAGYKYNYVISLNEDECDFIYNSTEISNCYIINATVGEEAIVQIPIQDRINEFWVDYDATSTSDVITEDTDLSALLVEMVWEDFDGDVTYSYELMRDDDNKAAVRFAISSEKQEGNFVFAVKQKNKNGTYMPLWSWHLWFTNYNPDKIAEANINNIEADVDRAYTLDGYKGAVHRYSDINQKVDSVSVWSNIYKDKFIMDRNIGERNEYVAGCGAGSVYYQYGRKDPFPGLEAKYYNDEYNSMPSKWVGASTFSMGVEYCDHFLCAFNSPHNWCNEQDARFAKCIWYDKKFPASGYKTGKSIFDPSPLGWRVPVTCTWNNFKNTGSEQARADSTKSVGVYNDFGYRDASNFGALVQTQNPIYVWSSTQALPNSGYAFYFSETEVYPSVDMYVSYAFSVRAIQE